VKKIVSLPMVEPQFICYRHLSFSNAIIRANAKEDSRGLLSTKYINCCFKASSNDHKFILLVSDHWCIKEKTMEYQLINLLKNTYAQLNIDLVRLMKKCLLDGCYVFGQCNPCYLGLGDQNGDVFHFLVTGYNDCTNTFTVYGIDFSEKLECYLTEYQKLKDAIFDLPKDNIAFSLWRYHPGNEYSVDTERLTAELQDYLNSISRTDRTSDGNIYGISAISALQNYFCECIENGECLNEAYLHKLMMHKCFMRERVELLAEHGLVSLDTASTAHVVEQLGKTIYEVGRQYNHSKERTLIPKLISCFEQSMMLEHDYLPHVLHQLIN